jgi:circadian clock protein KaiC
MTEDTAAAPQSGPEDHPIDKTPTGIAGFDDITDGGLPAGRLTAVMGSPGAGKTIFALQTLVNRVRAGGEAGIFVAFEEPPERIRRNVASFDWNFGEFSEKITLIDARVPLDAIYSGAFDLAGLLEGLSSLAAQAGARNIVFDGVDILLSGLNDERLERQELMRLDEWVRKSDVSAIITVKSYGLGERHQVRNDFLQYITDCAVSLDCSFTPTGVSRVLRVIKYRGSGFSANPVPYVIGRSGFDLVAFEGRRISYPAFTDRVSSGIPRLDALLTGGYIRGSSILVSGAPGTSKTSLGTNFLDAACKRGERALFISFDEGSAQIVSNMKSVGLDLAPHLDSGLLQIEGLLSSGCSPEEHFVAIRNIMDSHEPRCLLIDPISSLLKTDYAFSGMISESLLDQAKSRGITLFCTSLLEKVSGEQEISASRVSTIADTWIHVAYVARDGERNRTLTIVKSRGTGHSNQVRELVLSRSGLDLFDVYVAEGEVLLGSARAQKEDRMRRQQMIDELDFQRRSFEMQRNIADLEVQAKKALETLEWKRQEAALMETAEKTRITEDRADAARRRDLRRVDDDESVRPAPQSDRGI